MPESPESLNKELIEAAEDGHTEVVKELLKKGANVNACNSSEETALMMAVKTGNPLVVKALIDKGADVNAKDKKGTTPLMLAVENRRYTVAKLLLKTSGIKVDEKNKKGETALMLATNEHGMRALLMQSAKGPIEKIAKAPVNTEDSNALIRAANEGHTDEVVRLLKKGADVKAKDTKDKTPLMRAIENGHTEIVAALERHIIEKDTPTAEHFLEEIDAYRKLLSKNKEPALELVSNVKLPMLEERFKNLGKLLYRWDKWKKQYDTWHRDKGFEWAAKFLYINSTGAHFADEVTPLIGKTLSAIMREDKLSATSLQRYIHMAGTLLRKSDIKELMSTGWLVNDTLLMLAIKNPQEGQHPAVSDLLELSKEGGIPLTSNSLEQAIEAIKDKIAEIGGSTDDTQKNLEAESMTAIRQTVITSALNDALETTNPTQKETNVTNVLNLLGVDGSREVTPEDLTKTVEGRKYIYTDGKKDGEPSILDKVNDFLRPNFRSAHSPS